MRCEQLGNWDSVMILIVPGRLTGDTQRNVTESNEPRDIGSWQENAEIIWTRR
jgi:hypothetical protein